MAKGGFLRTSILRQSGAFLGILLFLACFSGCQRRYTYDECYELLPKDPNMAAGMAIVQTAKTEAATEAKIRLISAAVEMGCIGAAILCVAGIFLGRFLQSKLIVQLCAAGIIVFAVGWALMAAKIKYPATIATIGLVILLSIFATLIAIIIINRKALVQVVMGNEDYKFGFLCDETPEHKFLLEDFRGKQKRIQSKTTEAIVNKIRKG